MKHLTITRLVCALLSLCLLCGGLVACSEEDSTPEGYQNATCNGEYFRLYIPTQWTPNTESGVSGGYYSLSEGTAVSMMEVEFELPDAKTGTGDTDAAEDATTAEGETAPAAPTSPLEAFAASHVADVSGMPAFTVLRELTDSSLNINLDGDRVGAKEIRYTAKVGDTTYGYRQVMIKVRDRFYLFTYSAIYDAAALEQQELGKEAISRWDETVQGILDHIEFYAYPYEGGEHDRKIPAIKDVPDGMQLVTGNDVAYRFFAPADWVIGQADAAALVYASETDRSNVSVMGYVPEAEGYSVANYWEDTVKVYRATLDGFPTEEIRPAEATLGGNKASVYEFTYSLGGVTYKCRQTICVYGYMIVVMTYTALPENYDKHLDAVQQMQDALTFRTPVIG